MSPGNHGSLHAVAQQLEVSMTLWQRWHLRPPHPQPAVVRWALKDISGQRTCGYIWTLLPVHRRRKVGEEKIFDAGKRIIYLDRSFCNTLFLRFAINEQKCCNCFLRSTKDLILWSTRQKKNLHRWKNRRLEKVKHRVLGQGRCLEVRRVFGR